MVAVTDPKAITGSFDRRTEARAVAKSNEKRIVNPSPSDHNFEESFEAKRLASLEAFRRFWNGSGNWEEIIAVWKQIMDSEGISWDDIAEQIRQKKDATQETYQAEGARKTATLKERKIRRSLDAAFYIMTVWVVG
jgi:hypothetical protein